MEQASTTIGRRAFSLGNLSRDISRGGQLRRGKMEKLEWACGLTMDWFKSNLKARFKIEVERKVARDCTVIRRCTLGVTRCSSI